ncbi:hypothetical protein Salat_0139600 [Sesamum alatum]|uniref:Uncharacterized protein n=1 Tax=Sesamum alatum TaxID=300844 RepID=A0AAE1YWT9_9LAMI|nr:hypothetical protein Salat_0139600 [Sesamum alatum]
MAIWNDVVRLMQDLDQLLSSYTFFFGRELGRRPLTEEEHRILRITVGLMESLLGENYSHGFMNQILETRIRNVAQEAGNYIDFGAVRSLAGPFPDPRTVLISGAPTRARITEEILSINEELKKIHDQRKLDDLEVTSSTGKLRLFIKEHSFQFL